MAQVPIPWFTGGPVVSAGKAMKQQRMLRSLSQDMFSVGALLRSQRSQGLPKGATDADLANEESSLEAQLGHAQGKAVADTTSPHEAAVNANDPATAQHITDDPGGYAAGQHEGKQSFLPRLGGFMKTGIERLLWGDPQRAQRIAHIRRMQGELEFEKRRMNFIKTAVPIAAASEDPDQALDAMGGREFNMTHIPKKALTPHQRGTGAGSDLFAPGVAGGATDKEFLTRAYNAELQARGGKLPAEGDEEGWRQFRDNVMQRAIKEKDAHQAGIEQGRRTASDQSFAHRLELREKYFRQRKADKDAETGGGSKSTMETQVVDENGNVLTPQEATKRRAQGKPVNERKVRTTTPQPLHPKDPGTAIGAPPFLAP